MGQEKPRRAGTGRIRLLWATFGLASLGLGCPADPLDAPARLEADGRIAEAGEAYLAAAKADPALLAAWDGAIRIFCRERHDVGRCLATLDYELELLGPVDRHAAELATALVRRARARLEKGLLDPARSDVARAEKVAPRSAQVHAAWARLHLASGDRRAARERLEEARRLDPELPELEALWTLTRTSTLAPADDPPEADLPPFGR